jgi:hypothetical protein
MIPAFAVAAKSSKNAAGPGSNETLTKRKETMLASPLLFFQSSNLPLLLPTKYSKQIQE